ncbi:ferric reduction oxidase 8, mitochondrial-like isoform X2 [Impatiens glandulifera]|nr:ferric reduction oxidase 8, mitochondrial-like isoform X2 [Impatiens glandulifera]
MMMPVKSLKLNGWQFKFSRAATRCGLLAEACLALLFLPVLRILSVFRYIGVQFESSVKYHVWLGTAMIFFATVHGTCTWFIWGINHLDEMWRWQRTGRIYLAGEIGLVTGLVIWITSLPWIRRKKFEVFYYTHHLYVVFVVFFLFHAGDRRFYTVLPVIFLYGIDKLVRIVQSRSESTCVLSARVFPCKAVELTLPKDPRLKYNPTSIVFMKIPSISRFQWHCFSLSSSSMVEEHTMSIIIKAEGWWTGSLYEKIQAELGGSKAGPIPVAIEGPYGPASLNILRYESLLLVAGGSGITPFLSILQEIVYADQNKRGNRLPAEAELIYVTKNSQDVSLLQPLFRQLAKKSTSQLRLRVRLFVTQERRNNLTLRQLTNEISRTELVRFETKQSDRPIGGVENSGSMAVIVWCCSVVFLFLTCVFNVVFVQPAMKGKDKKKKIPSTVTDSFLLCSFVAALGCGIMVAILLRLRRVKKDDDEKEKLSSSDEMDEMDENALEENCEINFTGRPCFKDIFSELTKDRRSSEIGVLVCGPETMKESVASSLPKLNRALPGQPRFDFHSLTFTL